MDIQYYGANCVRLSAKKASVVIDDTMAGLGLKSPAQTGDIALFTSAHGPLKADVKIIIDQPGEYEVSNTSITGISARAHMDESGKKTATVYKIILDDLRIAVLGHIYPELSDDQLEALGTIDVLIVPVGGHGYTLDAIGALKMIKKIEPKLIIPTHYADSKINYEVPQADLETALKELAMEPKETAPRLKLKSSELGEVTQLIVLERQ